MNARFWEWIATVNARLVFLWTSLICLAILSSGVLLGGHGTMTIDPLLILGDPGDAVGEAAPGSRASIPASVENELDVQDPFASELLVSLQQREQHRREEERRRAEEAQLIAEPVAAAPSASPEAPAGPPRQVQLLYRGMFTRPDGTVLALVENQTSGEIAFVREKDQFEGLRVGSIARTNLSLSTSRERPIDLATGQSAHVELEP